MACRTGPFSTIQSTVAIPDTNVNAMTAYEAKGNSAYVAVTTSGAPGNIEITAEISPDGGTTYYNHSRSWVVEADAADNYLVHLDGLVSVPGDYVKLSYQAASATGNITVKVFCFDSQFGDPGDVVESTISDGWGPITANEIIAVGASSTPSSAALKPLTQYTFTADTDCYVRISASAATSSAFDFAVVAGAEYAFRTTLGQLTYKLNVIQKDSPGNLALLTRG